MTAGSKLTQRIGALVAAVAAAILVVGLGIHLVWELPTAAAAGPAGPPQPGRERTADPGAPAISFIESPNPTCTRPVAGTGICYIEFGYLYVTAATNNYILSMTVTIDDRLRAYHGGFFQSTMFIPSDMTAPGYRVSCGAPGSAGRPDMGRSHSYIIRARESGGLSAANYGSVTCPADVVRLYVPLVRHR